jgi:hypothetical protein
MRLPYGEKADVEQNVVASEPNESAYLAALPCLVILLHQISDVRARSVT